MSKLTRRDWTKRLLMAGGVAILGAAGYKRQEAVELLHRGKAKLDRLSTEWASNRKVGTQSQGDPYYRNAPIPNESEYKQFLSALGLRYLTADEIIRPHRNYRNGVRNSIPPRALWDSMIEPLKIADELRHRLGVRVTVLSGYRSMDYNSAIGGASRSQHMRNRALDLKFKCSSDEAFALAEQMREEGLFTGGIGWYPSFIHIDTRGYAATWGKES